MPSPLKYRSFSAWKKVSVGQAPNGVGAASAGRRAHRLEHVFVGDDERALRARFAELAGEISGDQLRARLGNLQVAAGVIGVRMRVHDEANRLVAGDLLDRREQPVGVLLAHRVDDEDPLRPDLEQRVAGSDWRAGRPVRAPAESRSAPVPVAHERPAARCSTTAAATPIAVSAIGVTNSSQVLTAGVCQFSTPVYRRSLGASIDFWRQAFFGPFAPFRAAGRELDWRDEPPFRVLSPFAVTTDTCAEPTSGFSRGPAIRVLRSTLQ